jgi:hypothetical protein
MICRRYRPQDFEHIRNWYNKRGAAPTTDLIPTLGFIVPGIAAGFLIATDTSCCIFEPFIANPDAPEELRDEALHKVMGDLINEAVILGYSRIFGFSTSKSMVERSLDWGFKVVEQGSITVLKEIK